MRLIATGLFAISIAANSASAAGILGDTVQIQYLYPNNTTQFGLSAMGTVTAAGVTLNLFGNQTVTVFPTDVQMVDVNGTGSSFLSAAFNGVSIQDLTNPSAFTSFSDDPVTNLAAFNNGDISLSGGILFINYQGL